MTAAFFIHNRKVNYLWSLHLKLMEVRWYFIWGFNEGPASAVKPHTQLHIRIQLQLGIADAN
jgi:hypothetical protein